MSQPPEADPVPAHAPVSVTVTRTGGFAGIRKEWHTEPPEEDVPRWVALIDGCPWDAVIELTGPGADRFVWRINARCGPEERGAELPDSDLQGPWRELVDEVRSADDVGRPDGDVRQADGGAVT
jgi:hypothetical protein